MPFVRANDLKLYLPGLRKVFVREFTQKDWIYNKFLYVASSTKRQEDDHSFFSGVVSIPQKGEGDNYDFGQVHSGYDKRWLHLTYAFGLQMTLEAQEDELYGVLGKFPTFLADASHHTIETLGHAVLNDGLAGSTNGPDGVPLFSASHPSLDGLQSNIPGVAADLSYTALEDAETNLYNMKNWEGHYIDFNEKRSLVYHPNSWALVKKINETTKGEPFTTNNTTNIMNGRYNLIMTPYLTDTDSWCVLPQPKDGRLMFWFRVRPTQKSAIDPNNENFKYLIRFRCTAGHFEWHGSYGSGGAG